MKSMRDRNLRRRRARMLLALACLPCLPALAAADLQAGKAKVDTVCAACHGANGVSVSDTIPNLAGQRAAYLEAQLNAWKDGSRKNPIMNAIGAQLSEGDIVNVAAYFASLPPVGGTAKSALLPHIVKTHVSLPDGYRSSYTRYMSTNYPQNKQVRHFYASPVAVQAVRAGKPMPDGSVILVEINSARLDANQKPVMGADGYFVAERVLGYNAMAREAGWGSALPEMLRNENWNYALLNATGQVRPGINQAECLACHKPESKSSYVFTFEDLAVKLR